MDYSENIKKVMEYIDENLSEELNTEKIAAIAGYSVFHFCRVFKEETGKTLMSYVREKRLDFAEKEIEEGKTTAEVAYKYGFETQSGFARAYKRKFGERPNEKID